MNLFEKIHNYQILSRLEKSNTYLLTSLEKSWLKTMLNHPDAPYFFSQDTLEKLRVYLDPYEKLPLDELFLEKAKSKEENRHHPFLSPLREIILKKNFVRLTTRTRTDRIFREQIGAPYKLEYSLTKKQWYLLWLHPKRKSVISTPLRLIQLAEEVESSDEEYDLMIQLCYTEWNRENKQQTFSFLQNIIKSSHAFSTLSLALREI
ncbi:hypothetical protein [Caldalkalibacillus mannanilyticus]|uniref:hypothetical protein n=1 Tax=Caldalkalibacillus mannanilyticus TaxID=1418 RepID=UPI0006851DAF|nr:hypothetical protein [Caldalkalibacillus mannanilyticus]